jgi:hypothetical protein
MRHHRKLEQLRTFRLCGAPIEQPCTGDPEVAALVDPSGAELCAVDGAVD